MGVAVGSLAAEEQMFCDNSLSFYFACADNVSCAGLEKILD